MRAQLGDLTPFTPRPNRADRKRVSSSIEVPASGGTDLGDYVRIVRHRLLLVLVVAALVVGGGVFYGLSQPKTFTSKASVLVQSADDQAGGGRGEQLTELETEAQVMRSVLVAEAARDQLKEQGVARGTSVRGLLRAVTVEVPEDTRVLVLRATDDDRRQAQRIAQAFVESYLAVRTTQSGGRTAEQLASVDAQLTDASEELRQVNEVIADRFAPRADVIDAQTRRDVLTRQITELEERRSDVLASGGEGGTIISPATLPKGQARTLGPRELGALAVGGLALGMLAGFIRERMDDRLRESTEVSGALGVPILAEIPVLPRRRTDAASGLVTVHDPDGFEADAFRRLRSNVLVASLEDEARVIIVTSARSGEGKSTVAANLAVSLSSAGRSVVLVSADLRCPTLEDLFDVSNYKGLSSVLAGTEDLASVLRTPGPGSLTLLPSGPPAALVGDLASSTAMAGLVLSLRELFDFVVMDTPPILAVADTLAMAPLADATILVVSASEVAGREITDAAEQLEKVGARVLGAVLNRTRAKEVDSAYYGRRSTTATRL